MYIDVNEYEKYLTKLQQINTYFYNASQERNRLLVEAGSTVFESSDASVSHLKDKYWELVYDLNVFKKDFIEVKRQLIDKIAALSLEDE